MTSPGIPKTKSSSEVHWILGCTQGHDWSLNRDLSLSLMPLNVTFYPSINNYATPTP